MAKEAPLQAAKTVSSASLFGVGGGASQTGLNLGGLAASAASTSGTAQV
jgi:hypothetical protein